MHLIETYATNCGVKIDKPFILEKYFPLDAGAYITFHPTSKDAKTYDLWQDVIDILLPFLNLAKIQILQLGAPNERVFRGCYSTVGQTTVNQVAYLIRNGLLHFGVDSFPVHVASMYDKKIVALYSSNFSHCVGPYWGGKKNQILIDSPKNGKKPSFSTQENPKTINNIRPEEIAKAVCDLLEIDFVFPFETLSVGANYLKQMIEWVPAQNIDPNIYKIDNLIVRMDFYFNEDLLANQLGISNCSIITNKPINKHLIERFRSKIKEVIYIIDESNDPSFVGLLQKLGIKYALLTEMDDDRLNEVKLDYFDFATINRKLYTLDEKVKNCDPAKLCYRTSKFTLHDNKIFPSKMAYLNNQPIPSILQNFAKVATSTGEVKNLKELFKEEEYCIFLKEK